MSKKKPDLVTMKSLRGTLVHNYKRKLPVVFILSASSLFVIGQHCTFLLPLNTENEVFQTTGKRSQLFFTLKVMFREALTTRHKLVFSYDLLTYHYLRIKNCKKNRKNLSKSSFDWGLLKIQYALLL